MAPGILVQMITTKQPSDDQIEVAIVSMEQALEADGETVPSGSGEFPSQPLVLGLANVAAASIPGTTAPPASIDPPPGS